MKNIFYFMIASLVITCMACNEEIPLSIQTDYVGFDKSQTAYQYLRVVGDPTPVNAGMRVQLIGAQRSTATNVTFEVIDTSTSAIKDLHYTISSNMVSIPANANYADLPIQIIPDNINGGEEFTLALNITGGDGAIEGDFKRADFTIAILCPSGIDVTKTYNGVTTTGAFGLTSSSTVTLTAVSDNTYKIDDAQVTFITAFGCCADGNMESVIFQDVCNTLSIINPDPDANNIFNWVTDAGAGFGPGSYDPATGIFTLPMYQPDNDFGLIVEFTPN